MRINDLYQSVTQGIILELEAGAIPWVKNWNGGSALPTNASTKKAYSGINVPILWHTGERRGYEHQLWLTYKQALEIGAQVRKGEQGTHIVYTSLYTKVVDDEPSRKRFLKTYSVFNVAQIDRYKLPVVEPKTPVEQHTEAEKIIADTKAVIHHGGDRACYIPSLDIIKMPERKSFENMPSYYSTAFHELGHWTGDKTRLERDMQGRFGTRAYAAEELVAELCAAFLCAHIGIKGELRHSGYIDSWIQLLKGDDRAIFTASSKAQQAADFINLQKPDDQEFGESNVWIQGL